MTEAVPRLTFNEAILGVEQAAGTVDFSEALIRRYSETIGHPLPGAEEGIRLEAPIGMVNAFFSRDVHQGSDVKLEGATVGLNAGRAIEVLEPILSGTVLNRFAVLKDVYTKTGRSGTMAFEVWEILFKDSDGKIIARASDSMVYRAPGGAPEGGPRGE
ncbi:MAG: hypothetical protein O3B84_04785 [Chloroflexi bacterium]|nr:hypothetical protein [Chloroflexota bacterium]